MKKRITLFLLFTSFLGFAQYALIPDPNFEKALIDLGIDNGPVDGRVLTAQIKDLTYLNVASKNITDLTGIEAFTKLEILIIGIQDSNTANANKINTLNLSSNLNLTYLHCSFNNLTLLDLSNNIYLNTLAINDNKLTSLDISNNTALKNLNCNGNQITNLDLSANINLENLNCTFNKLTILNTSKNIQLRNLSCDNNLLSTLDFSDNPYLTLLFCNNNNLINLNILKNRYLTTVVCNNNQLSNIDVSQNPLLLNLDFDKNQISNIDISNNPNLVVLHCAYNTIRNLDVSKNILLTHIYANNNLLENLDLSKNTVLAVFSCSNNKLTRLNLKNGNNTNISSLDLKSNLNLKCIQVDNKSYSDSNWSSFKDNTAAYSTAACSASATAPPVLSAAGDQLYCPTTDLKIVTAFSITHDVNETGTLAAYIQISSGYSSGFDRLKLANPSLYPNIRESWDSLSGKLTLTNSAGTELLYSDIVNAVKDIVFTNSSTAATGSKTFSITIGQANYLPSTQHFYLFVPSIGISWTSAKAVAEASTYYALKGYLATILSADEAKLIGEQASGTGWIGGSDAEIEGTWKWVTGPEAGTVFWNGATNGSSPSFAFWNSGEPNQLGDEDYAHITQPGVGTRGSWNDLSNTGDASGSYQPKGYVVEYGGMPGETPLQIAASTKITIMTASPGINPSPVCDSGTFTFNAAPTIGATIRWFDAATGGNLLATGNTYTTPILNTTTTYYVDAGCEANRKSVVATVNKTPLTPTADQPVYNRCGSGSVTIKSSSNIGTINWFTTSTGGTSVFNGNSFTTPTISSNTTYYAEANNAGCINPNRIPVNIEVYTPPVVADEDAILCQFETVTLDAGISGMSYLWSNGATTRTINISQSGTYTVDVTSPAPENCTSRKTIIVDEHLIPEISRIVVNGTKVEIQLKKEEFYFEYSIDGINFQNSNIFYEAPAGLHTAYVQEKNGCGGAGMNFVVLVFPAFFTPNNDSYNDFWEVTGMENYPQAEVSIFDRYGKLITQLNSSKMSWDGTFETIPMPSSDYWYALKIDDTKPILRGHFSLKR